MKCKHCGQEIVKPLKVSEDSWVWIPELKLYVEKDVHHKNHSYDQLKEIYGKDFEKMLLTKSQVEVLNASETYRNIFKMRTWANDFFIQQYDSQAKKEGYVADFFAYWDSADFYCRGYSWDSDYFRGVRLCRKKISKSSK